MSATPVRRCCQPTGPGIAKRKRVRCVTALPTSTKPTAPLPIDHWHCNFGALALYSMASAAHGVACLPTFPFATALRESLRGYDIRHFSKDALAGITVGLI